MPLCFGGDLLAFRVEVIYFAIPVGANREIAGRRDLVTNIRVAVWLLPQPYTIQEVVHVFEITFIPYPIDAHLIVTVILDEFSGERRFREYIGIIILPL
jgi:hypothetical protein